MGKSYTHTNCFVAIPFYTLTACRSQVSSITWGKKIEKLQREKIMKINVTNKFYSGATFTWERNWFRYMNKKNRAHHFFLLLWHELLGTCAQYNWTRFIKKKDYDVGNGNFHMEKAGPREYFRYVNSNSCKKSVNRFNFTRKIHTFTRQFSLNESSRREIEPNEFIGKNLRLILLQERTYFLCRHKKHRKSKPFAKKISRFFFVTFKFGFWFSS